MSHLENVIIVGAGGQIGSNIVQQLLKQNKHKVTALTRPESTSAMPEGITVRKADYSKHDELVAAMKGQDVLIITMGAMAPPENSIKLIDAAADAGVKYIVPNEWSSDRDQVAMSKEMLLADGLIAVRSYIESKGLKWVSIGCGFWYEFSLAGHEVRFGFDFSKKSVTFYDEGTTKISVTTWPLTALALARVLALPVTGSPSLSQFDNNQVLVSSFHVSQRDMLDSILRVTGDKESDWTITHEEIKERYGRGMKMMQSGDFTGFGIAMYARAFFPGDNMDHEAKKVNALLGLPQEDLDSMTKVAIEMAAAGAVA